MPVALVTGASRGLGLEVTRQLAARGHTVIVGARDPGAVLAVDGDVQPVRLDVTDDGTIAALAGAFADLLRASPQGRLVNVSSGGGALTGMRDGAPAYSVSKAALNALTLMLADALRADGVLVNPVWGWVDQIMATDMGGPGGRSLADGAAGIVWAATLPDGGPTGGFFRDGRPIDW